MTLPQVRPFRLVERGGSGLSCDIDGIALGGVPLTRIRSDEGGLRMEVRPANELSEILSLAYGDQSVAFTQRCYRGLRRAATQLEFGDLAMASLEAVLIGCPDLLPESMAKLSKATDLWKGGEAWQDQPRVPAGQSGGGQWTTDGSGAGDALNSPGARDPQLSDGVFRPGDGSPQLTPTGGAEDAEEGFRHGIGGNEPPYDPMTLQDIFPGLKDQPGIAVPLAPLDSFLGVSALADGANLAATEGEYYKLVRQIRAIDPSWRADDLQNLAEMTSEGRANTIRGLLIQRAVAYYKLRGDIRPLQVETLRFLQDEVDKAYAEAEQQYDGGNLRSPLSRSLAIGNRVDELVREQLKELYERYGIRFGTGQNITVNNRDPSSSDQTYRIPDARLGRVSFDWSLVFKTFSNAQIRGFFRADSEPDFVVIIRPSQVGGRSAYIIPRPPGVIRKGDPWSQSINHIFRSRWAI